MFDRNFAGCPDSEASRVTLTDMIGRLSTSSRHRLVQALDVQSAKGIQSFRQWLGASDLFGNGPNYLMLFRLLGYYLEENKINM